MSITAKEFEDIFDAGEADVLQYCDMKTVRQPNLQKRSIHVEVSLSVAKQLDAQAKELGLTDGSCSEGRFVMFVFLMRIIKGVVL